jgi:hypothetical protein
MQYNNQQEYYRVGKKRLNPGAGIRDTDIVVL